MNRKPLAQQKEEATVEKVFASRRTRESRGSFDNANEHARQREEERLAKRQKPKRKKLCENQPVCRAHPTILH